AGPGPTRCRHHPYPAWQRHGGNHPAPPRVGTTGRRRPSGTLRHRCRQFGRLRRCADRRPRGGRRDHTEASATPSGCRPTPIPWGLLRTRGAAQPVEDCAERLDVVWAAVSASVAAAPSTPKAAPAGSAVRDGKFEFQVLDITRAKTVSDPTGNPYLTTTAQ